MQLTKTNGTMTSCNQVIMTSSLSMHVPLWYLLVTHHVTNGWPQGGCTVLCVGYECFCLLYTSMLICITLLFVCGCICVCVGGGLVTNGSNHWIVRQTWPGQQNWNHGQGIEVLFVATSDRLSRHPTKDGRATDSCFTLIGNEQYQWSWALHLDCHDSIWQWIPT